MPSNENTAVPMKSGKSLELNSLTSATPLLAMIKNSLPKMYNSPRRINPSAMRAVELSLVRFLTRESGRKTTSSKRMKYCTGNAFLQLVTPRTKDCKFSATKMV